MGRRKRGTYLAGREGLLGRREEGRLGRRQIGGLRGGAGGSRLDVGIEGSGFDGGFVRSTIGSGQSIGGVVRGIVVAVTHVSMKYRNEGDDGWSENNL